METLKSRFIEIIQMGTWRCMKNDLHAFVTLKILMQVFYLCLGKAGRLSASTGCTNYELSLSRKKHLNCLCRFQSWRHYQSIAPMYITIRLKNNHLSIILYIGQSQIHSTLSHIHTSCLWVVHVEVNTDSSDTWRGQINTWFINDRFPVNSD